MKINIQIDELVLEGFDYHDHRRISEAMKAELIRLIERKGLGDAAKERNGLARVTAPSFRFPTDRNPRIIGGEIARSVFRTLNRH